MCLRRALLLVLAVLAAAGAQPPYNDRDVARQPEYLARQADWRNGAVVYQIFVDRFAPSRHLETKRALYAAPRKLRGWDELPVPGPFLKEDQIWSHEVDYWGGDLDSVRGKLDYLQQLGVDVVYLNPIFESLSNHKYDASDYHKVDPVYGSRAELAQLAADLHGRGMRLMLDGVFNHMGRRSPMFQDALKGGRFRDFFTFTTGNEYVGWLDVANLPELKLENPAVQDFLYRRPDSVVQSYLRQEKIDGWRLDVAFDLGFRFLADLTRHAHEARPGCDIIGEIWNYPEEWYPAVDGVMNMHGKAILMYMLNGKLAPAVASQMWDQMVAEAGYDHLLKAWLVLDNHDTKRAVTEWPEAWQQRMARVLQFTLPGSVCLYYGSEVGLAGGDDPHNRAPMRWDWVEKGNATLALHKQLLALRKGAPALRWGDYRKLHSERLFAFLRKSLSARETVIVVANPSAVEVKEVLQVRDSKMQDLTTMKNALGPEQGVILAGTLEVTVPPHEVLVLQPHTGNYPKGYNRYDRLP